MHLVLDVENTVVYTDKDKINLGPFHPDNKLVSVGYKFIETDERGYLYFYHQDLTRAPDNAAKLQSVLDKATVLIAHNIKHDVMWLEESGFSVPDQLYCTMIAEYVLLRGQKGPLDLYTLSKEKGLTHKKSELIDKYLKDKKTFAEIPIDLVTEYGEADIDSCADLFLHQQEVYSKNPGLIKTRDMMMSMCRVLTTMERNGICIDLEALAKIKKEYEEEYSTIKKEQEQIIAEVMGDTPINLDSPEQMSMVLYSRKVKDKAKWASVFNIGLNDRGKPLRRPNMSKSEFIKNVRANTEIVRKTKAEHCTTCSGKGFYTKIKKDGTPFAKSTKCRHCCGHGFIYTAGGAVAGLRLTPSNIWDVTANGFATDKETLTRLSQAVEPGSTAFRFLQNAVKLNAISTYLDSFVGGIERNVILQTGIIHPKFNQTVTATGRLSSSDP